MIEQGNKQVIFLAENDIDDQIMFTEALSELNSEISIEVFNNGFDFLNQLNKENIVHTPSLIVINLNMPVLNGLEVLIELRKNAHMHHIPKIVWSTSNKSDIIKSCLLHGAHGYFQKPVDYSNYLIMVKTMINWMK